MKLRSVQEILNWLWDPERRVLRTATGCTEGTSGEMVTVGVTVASLDPLKYTGATNALVIVKGQPINAWWYGENPTATEGLPFASGSMFQLESSDEIAKFRAIRADSATSDSVLAVQYAK